MPYSYFEIVLGRESSSNWTFFDLNGCPRELIVPMMQLANLAAENEPASAPRNMTAFALTDLVDEIEASLNSWQYKPMLGVNDPAADDAEAMQTDRDRYHCCEAWRHGLLIYIQRVFRWRRGQKPPARLAYLARVTIDHVRSCRRTSTVQKQSLLPAFFAGAETTDTDSRQSIRDYCTWWYALYGYQMFETAQSLLEELWTQRDARWNDDTLWWGGIVDARQSMDENFSFG